jgi:sterol 3beta-glucosyltransferase
MHLTILALGSRGDVVPYAALGRGLVRAGHQVCFATFSDFGPYILERQMEFFPLRGSSRDRVLAAGPSMRRLVAQFVAVGQSLADDLSDPRLRQTDMVLCQIPGAMFGRELAGAAGVPLAGVAVMPVLPTSAYPMHSFPRQPSFIPGYNRLTYRLSEIGAWLMLARVINRWRTATLGLPPLYALHAFDDIGTADGPMLNGYSHHVAPPPQDWGPHFHVTGYWYEPADNWHPPVTLQRFLDSGPPPVFAGFGSMPLADPQRVAGCLLQAAEALGCRLMLGTGWGGLSAARLPAWAMQVGEVPYDWLFRRMAAIIHHGGAGTTGAVVRSGLPSICLPFVFDQFFWGRRLAELGTAAPPIPIKRLSPGHLADALASVIHNEELARRAQELAQKVNAEDGIARAIERIAARQEGKSKA